MPEDERRRPVGSDRGRWDYHDPTAGIGGSAPARSALTLRLVIASFGLVVFVALIVVAATVAHNTAIAVVCAVIAVTAVVDLVVVARRKRRGEPG